MIAKTMISVGGTSLSSPVQPILINAGIACEIVANITFGKSEENVVFGHQRKMISNTNHATTIALKTQ